MRNKRDHNDRYVDPRRRRRRGYNAREGGRHKNREIQSLTRNNDLGFDQSTIRNLKICGNPKNRLRSTSSPKWTSKSSIMPINQARKELATRFDFKGVTPKYFLRKTRSPLPPKTQVTFVGYAKFSSANFPSAGLICAN